MEQTIDLLAAMSLAGVARELTEQADVAATRRRVVDMAATLVGCAATGLIRVGSGAFQSVLAAHDAHLVAAEQDTAGRFQQGVAVQAWADQSVVGSSDLSSEDRWPDYAATLVNETPIRSIIGLPLSSNGSDLGVLVLYAVEPGYFTESIAGLAVVFAEHAAIGLAHAQSRAKTADLEIALTSNREIGVAVGILVTRHRVSPVVGFELLKRRSQDQNIKLHEVAADVVRKYSPDPVSF